MRLAIAACAATLLAASATRAQEPFWPNIPQPHTVFCGTVVKVDPKEQCTFLDNGHTLGHSHEMAGPIISWPKDYQGPKTLQAGVIYDGIAHLASAGQCDKSAARIDHIAIRFVGKCEPRF